MPLTDFFRWNPTSREDEPLEPIDPTAIPAATIEWKNGEKTAADPDLAALLARGANLKAKGDAIKDELNAIKTEILNSIDPGVTVRVDGIATVVISEREIVTVLLPATLEQVLGPRFTDLVRIETKHYITPKLMEIANDRDSPLAPIVMSTLKIDRTATISYRDPK